MAKLSPGAKEFYEPRIGDIQLVFLIIIYGLVYVLQFFLDLTVLLSLLAAFIGFVVTCALTLYLYFKGAYKSKKNAAYKQLATLATFLVEIIPEIDLVPGDILDVGLMFMATRSEDHKTAEEKAAASVKTAQDQRQRAIQYSEYIQRKQLEQQNAIAVANDNARAVATNDNATIRAANDEENESEFDDFEYKEAA